MFRTHSKTNWLLEAQTVEDLKNLYRKLAFIHHPDLGGNTEIMQEINAEYEYRLKLLEAGQKHHSNNNHSSSSRSNSNKKETYTGSYQDFNSSPPPPSTEKPDPKDAREAFETATAYAAKANPWFHVATLENGEVVAWGRTFPHKDFLRENGFWWDPERRCWHFVRKPFSPFDVGDTEQGW